MLKDANAYSGATGYSNLSQVRGRIVVDLNGYTLTSQNAIWPGTAKAWGTRGVFETNITMKNGELVLDDGLLLNYNTSKGSYEGENKKNYVFNFEDLNISFAEGHSKSALVQYQTPSTTTVPLDSIFDISFKSCEFDIRNVTNSFTLFSTDHPESEAGLIVNYKVEGSNIIANDAGMAEVCNFAGANSSIEYVKAAQTGDYITLTLPEGADASAKFYDINGEIMRYKSSMETGDGNVIYKLAALTEYEILDYDIEEKSAKIVITEDDKYAVVFASYNGDFLQGLDVVEVELEAGVREVAQESDFVADEVILLDSLENMKPLCESKKVVLIMAIGNSFAVDSVTYLDDIAAADGVKLTTYNLYIGGQTLEEHYNALNNSTTYDFRINGVTTGTRKTIKDTANLHNWDYVILQGTTHKNNTRYDDVFWGLDNETGEAVDATPIWTTFKDEIAATVPDAKRLVHATWAQNEAAAKVFNGGEFADGIPDARGAMTSKILERAQLGADIYSTQKREDGEGAYIPTAVAVDYLIRYYGFPELEKNSSGAYLNNSSTRGLYRDATCHLTENVGRILAGLVWYEMITGTPATESKYTRSTLSDEDMKKIKAAAHYACENYMSYDPTTADPSLDRTGRIYEPESGIVNPPVVAERITTALPAATGERAAVVMAELDANLNVTDENGAVLTSAEKFIDMYRRTVIPAFVVDSEKEADAIAELIDEKALSDCYVMAESENAELVKRARMANETTKLITGALIFDELNSPEARSEARELVSDNMCYAAISNTPLTEEAAFYFAARQIAAWGFADSAAEVYRGIANGYHGIVSENVSEVYDVYESITEPTVSGKTVVIAHRGANASAATPYPENTLIGIRAAKELYGADAIELDFGLTKDGYIILMHDNTVDRTTDGTGNFSSFTLEEIKALTVDYVAGKETTVPTLEEVLQLAKELDVVLYCHVKDNTDANIAAFSYLVEKYDCKDRVLLFTGKTENFNSYTDRTYSGTAYGLVDAPVVTDSIVFTAGQNGKILEPCDNYADGIFAMRNMLTPYNYQPLYYPYSNQGDMWKTESFYYQLSARGFVNTHSVTDGQDKMDSVALTESGAVGYLTNNPHRCDDYHYAIDVDDVKLTMKVGDIIELPKLLKLVKGTADASCSLLQVGGTTLDNTDVGYTLNEEGEAIVVFYATRTADGGTSYRIYSEPVRITFAE